MISCSRPQKVRSCECRIGLRRCLDRAAAQVGLDGLVPRELRHTAASLAIASVRTSRRKMLGHDGGSRRTLQFSVPLAARMPNRSVAAPCRSI